MMRFGAACDATQRCTLRLFALFSLAASGTTATLQVGPGQQHATPCAAIAAASAGDTIQIHASGNYAGDVCRWTTNDLTLIGVNGRPTIAAAGRSSQGKAIWVISGDNTTVDNIEFTGAAVPNHNGAAIRQEGANLTLRNCYIHNNEEGILAGDNPLSKIVIETSEFAENGYSNGFSHNIYINHIAEFTLRFSYSHDSVSGHLVKSRAANNFILYNRLTGESGTSSYELDLPDGGLSYVIGNSIEQGPSTENPTIVAYGEEGVKHSNSALIFVNNTVVNNHGTGVFITVGEGASQSFVMNNIFSGRGTVIDDPNARLSRNLVGGALFVDPSNYDYHLQVNSPARDFGGDPGIHEGFSLRPVYQYVHPACFETRRQVGSGIDAGAFELRGGGGASASCAGGALKTTQ